jgi:hypothetical protein
VIAASTVGALGQRARSIGLGGTLTFPNVNLFCGGVYDLTINYINGDATARSATVSVNGSDYPILTFPAAGDWAAGMTQQGVTTTIHLTGGADRIILANPSAPAPDVVGVTLQRRRSAAKRSGSSDSFCAQHGSATLLGGG